LRQSIKKGYLSAMPQVINISILGCGWYGTALAKTLVNAGYHVKGSTTSPQKLEVLD
jgi:glycerol-3-phosphate dehydrogenase